MKKQIQFWLLFVHVFILRFKKYIFIGSISGFFIIFFIYQSYPYLQHLFDKKHINIGYVGNFTENNLPLFIQNQISLGLTSLTPSGEATPSLAKGWEADSDGLNYNFYLYPDLYWHDGKKFTAKDINFQLQGTTFIPVSENQVKITLKQPYTPIPVVLSKPLIKPGLIGLGFYKVIKINYSGDYLSSLLLQPLNNTLPAITYKFYSTTYDAIQAFKLGEINTIQNITDIGDFKQWKNIKITENTLYDRYVGLFFNLKNSFYKEKEIRQALNYATPSFDQFEKVYSPISKLSWAYSSKIRLYHFDPEAAQKLVTKSPLSSPSAQITITTYASLLSTAQTIADAWNKIGLNVKVRIQPSIPSDYDILVITQPIPPDPDQYQYWQSTQEVTNISHYSNLKIDKLLEDGRKTLDKDTREKIYIDFQRYLVEDSPVIFLYYPKVYTVERK